MTNPLRPRHLRQALTPQEACLWLHLKEMRGQGTHWRKQAPFSDYILDFVTFGHRLVVEVDGSHHHEDVQAEHDMIRDKVLARQGFRTMRFTNRQIDREIGWVLDAIREAMAARLPTLTASRSFPPDKREGLMSPRARP